MEKQVNVDGGQETELSAASARLKPAHKVRLGMNELFDGIGDIADVIYPDHTKIWQVRSDPREEAPHHSRAQPMSVTGLRSWTHE